MFPNVLADDISAIPSLADLGMRCLQVRPEVFCDEDMKPTQAGLAALRAMEDSGLELAGWCAYKPLIGGDEIVRPSVDHIKRVIDAAAHVRDAVGCAGPSRVMSESGNPASYPQFTEDEKWAQIVAATQEIAAHAEKRDVVFAFEPTRSNIIDSSAAAKRIIEQVGSDHVRVCYDAANTVGDKDTLDGSIEHLGDLIVLAHAKDVIIDDDGKPTYPSAGKGSLDYPRMIALLNEVETCTQIVIEYVRTPEQANETIEFLRPFCD